MIDNTDLTAATATHSRLSVALDECLKKEQKTKLLFLQKEADIRKEFFPQVAVKEISVAYFEQVLKDQSFQERIDWEEAKTSRQIAKNQLDAAKEILNSLKIKIRLI